MSGNLSNIDPNTPAEGNFEPLEPGKYDFEIEVVDFVRNKNDDGDNLVLTFKRSGAQIMQWLCVNHPTEKTQTIARGKLARLFQVTGFNGIQADENKLLGKKLVLNLGVEPHSYVNKENKKIDTNRNTIKGYFPYESLKGQKTDKNGSASTPGKSSSELPASFEGDEIDIPF